jgi:hypothetical protein
VDRFRLSRRTGTMRTPILKSLLSLVYQIRQDERKNAREQRHTGKRCFERLRDEHGYISNLARRQ